MITYRTRYKKYLVEVYVPESYSGRSVLLLPGLPVSSNVRPIVETFLDAGAVVFYPNFSGSFDSYGTYSPKSAIADVRKLYPLLFSESITELYFGKRIELGKPKEVILAGMSYGAGIALHGNASLFDKILLLSPALLFNPDEIGGEEGRSFFIQMKHLLHLLKVAHPLTYRVGFSSGLRRYLLGRDSLVLKVRVCKTLNALMQPTMIFHGAQDASVPVSVTKTLESTCNNPAISWCYIPGGHSTSSYPPEGLSKIQDFIRA
ncbi:MAG TPA: alpha/beta hydrolase [Candidatus Paceibacterota bacterium]|nr:alpha/beta hydrolase [Candidatus Paceibacterota bacterium]